MGSDEVDGDVPVVYEPGRRRATYTPPVRHKPADPADVSEPSPSETDVTVTPHEHIAPVHDDDEIASALEEQVSQYATAAPVPPTHQAAATPDDGVTPAGNAVASPDVVDLTDDQVVELIDEDIAAHGDTLSAIEKLERVLAVRAATMAIPIQVPPPAETVTELVVAAAPEPEPEPEATPIAGATSFDDVLAPAPPPVSTEPEPTFSSWIAPIADTERPQSSEASRTEVAAPEKPATEEEAPEEEATDEAVAEAPASAAPLPEEPTAEEASESSAQPEAAEPPTVLPPLSVDSVPLPVIEDASTQAQAIPPGGIDADVEDDADDVRIPPAAVLAPLASPRVGAEEEVLFDSEPVAQPVFRVETVSLEPTALDQRVGRAARMFWLWFGATSSLVSVGVGALLFALGLSLRQMIVATLVGVALSFLPLGLGTLAGKWSGLPTMVVSRATFGLKGNIIPALLALVTRLFWGAVLLWLTATAVGSLFTALGLTGNPILPTAVALVGAIAIAAAIAYFGYALVARVQLIVTIASTVLIVGMIAVTWSSVNVSVALGRPDAVWLRVVSGAVLVFSYLGLAWANSSSELARYQRPSSSGAASMLWATFGAALPPFVLISYGGLIAASNPGLASDLAHNPVKAFTQLGLPSWYPVPLLLAVVVSLVSAIVLNIYSGGFTLQSIGVTLARRWSVLVVAAGIAVVGVILLTAVPDFVGVLGLPTTLAVPVAAWAGLFSSDMMIRTRRFHPESLLRSGGVYPDWHWINLTMLVVASVVGLGLVRSGVSWLHWEGFLYPLIGVNPNGDLGTSNIGVLVALGLGLLTPLVSGIPAVRRQEGTAR